MKPENKPHFNKETGPVWKCNCFKISFVVKFIRLNFVQLWYDLKAHQVEMWHIIKTHADWNLNLFEHSYIIKSLKLLKIQTWPFVTSYGTKSYPVWNFVQYETSSYPNLHTVLKIALFYTSYTVWNLELFETPYSRKPHLVWNCRKPRPVWNFILYDSLFETFCKLVLFETVWKLTMFETIWNHTLF